MSKFTPGPWEYLCEIGYAGNYPYSKAHRVKIGKETLTIGCHGYDWEGGKEIAANARLIAAAPDLLKACKEFVRKCECGEARSRRSYAEMKAAIEKAEGAEG